LSERTWSTIILEGSTVVPTDHLHTHFINVAVSMHVLALHVQFVVETSVTSTKFVDIRTRLYRSRSTICSKLLCS